MTSLRLFDFINMKKGSCFFGVKNHLGLLELKHAQNAGNV